MILNKRNYIYPILLSAFFIFIIACKKDEVETEPDEIAEPPCMVNKDVLTINSLDGFITKDTSYINGDTILSADFEVSQDNGLSLRLSESQLPNQGIYAITQSVLDLQTKDNKAFLQLYINGQAFMAIAGTIEVFETGSQIRAKSCEMEVQSPVGSNYKISFNGQLN